MFKTVAALALLGMACAFSTCLQADELSRVPEAVVSYYDVKGSSEDEIRKAIERSPQRPRDGARAVDALTTWNYSWRTWGDGHGGCDPSRAEVMFTANVLLPRLVGQVPPDVARDWDRYIVNLRVHEGGHVTYAKSRMADVLAAAKSPHCADVKPAVERVLNEIRAHDRLYDAETSHGLKQGAVFP
ncbi:MAG TPA: DUF922 domain-containing protein [Rhizomicrobium sp.]|nr:DUF922 domain-containing protein [Rhizomicrobium sp.]